MNNTERCYSCGKFIPDKDLPYCEAELIWTGGTVPEPSHVETVCLKCSPNPQKALDQFDDELEELINES